jgi:hypothetical protein
MINIPGALWGDVFTAGNGVIGCAYDLGFNVIVEYFKLNAKSQEIVLGDLEILPFDERVLFVTADRNGVGEVVVMGQGEVTGRFLAGSNNNSFNPRILPTYGTHVCDLNPTLNGFKYIVQVSGTQYYDSETDQFHPIPEEIHGTSQGFVQMFRGQPIWSDLVRAVIPEMFFPFRQNDVYVGEGRTDPAHIQALENGIQKPIYYGVAERPRCAYDEESNIFAIASRGPNGVNFHLFRRPLPDVSVVVPPIEPPVEPPIPPVEPPTMACTPVVPQQNIIADSMNALRSFCQSYIAPPHALPEYANRKPYEHDEIHENGLFIADGLIYFLMSDTGRWAQILMNPDDKRDWNTKRQAADAALFDYMRRRVGDVPANSAPGGAMEGNVNIG